MSVVAGVSLLDGVLIGADCRITYGEGDTRTYRDELQKLIPIGKHTVIGLTGNIATASKLLLAVKKAQEGRLETVELEQWLPRYLKHQFPKIKNSKPVSFLVASVVPSRPNIVAKAEIAKAVFDAFSSRQQGGINTISSTFLNVINVPTDFVAIEGSGEGHLYAMHSPKFKPLHIKPMHSVAIGSGQRMQEQIVQIADQLHFDTHGDYPDVTWFRRSLDHYLRASDEATVGGMFTMMKITARHGMQLYPHARLDLTNKEAYELKIEGPQNRWVQRRTTTCETIELLLPWEVKDKEMEDRRFDGLRPKPASESSYS
jgi:hypothetical protein